MMRLYLFLPVMTVLKRATTWPIPPVLHIAKDSASAPLTDLTSSGLTAIPSLIVQHFLVRNFFSMFKIFLNKKIESRTLYLHFLIIHVKCTSTVVDILNSNKATVIWMKCNWNQILTINYLSIETGTPTGNSYKVVMCLEYETITAELTLIKATFSVDLRNPESTGYIETSEKILGVVRNI